VLNNQITPAVKNFGSIAAWCSKFCCFMIYNCNKFFICVVYKFTFSHQYPPIDSSYLIHSVRLLSIVRTIASYMHQETQEHNQSRTLI
jgi:hypothetical protein